MSILNINGSGGGGAYIRFMPSANAWVFNKAEIAIDNVVIDHDSVRTGWGKMAEGQAPEWSWDDRLGVKGQQPSPEHKRGFSVTMYTKQTGSVEWSSTGTGPVIGFDEIFETIWNGKDDNAGKVAVVKYTGSSPMKVGKGNTRVPQFSLVKWIPRDSVAWDSEPADAEPAKPAAKAAKAAPVEEDISF